MLTGPQLKAARALLRWTAAELAARSKVSLPTIKRAEGRDGDTAMTAANTEAVIRALREGGVELIDSNEAGPGVRLLRP